MRRQAWSVLILLVLAVACGGSESAPEKAAGGSKPKADAKSVSHKAPAVVESGAGEEEVLEYAYDPFNKRDPFRSFVLEETRQRKEGRGPLEQFELTQLKVVAVVWDTDNPRALVRDPSGRGYIVRNGTMMGKHDGRVTQIMDSGVVVKETYLDYLGEETQKDIELRVRPRHGG